MEKEETFILNVVGPVGLKENLREEDNLSTRDNWPVPSVSFVLRFYCTTKIAIVASV